MATRRQVDEIVARCVASAVFYVSSGKTLGAKAEMAADAVDAFRTVSHWELCGRAVEQAILRRLEGELTARYGNGPGRSLAREFGEAFWCKD
jgi:hypothetical protein